MNEQKFEQVVEKTRELQKFHPLTSQQATDLTLRMAPNQVRIALKAILMGEDILEAVEQGLSHPPTRS